MARTAVSMAWRWKSAKGTGPPGVTRTPSSFVLTSWVGRIGAAAHAMALFYNISLRKCHAAWNHKSTRTTVWEALCPEIVWQVQWLEHLKRARCRPISGRSCSYRSSTRGGRISEPLRVVAARPVPVHAGRGREFYSLCFLVCG